MRYSFPENPYKELEGMSIKMEDFVIEDVLKIQKEFYQGRLIIID